MERPKQLTNITKKEWLALAKAKYPDAYFWSYCDTSYVYPDSNYDSWKHTMCLAGHCSTGNYGWVK